MRLNLCSIQMRHATDVNVNPSSSAYQGRITQWSKFDRAMESDVRPATQLNIQTNNSIMKQEYLCSDIHFHLIGPDTIRVCVVALFLVLRKSLLMIVRYYRLAKGDNFDQRLLPTISDRLNPKLSDCIIKRIVAENTEACVHKHNGNVVLSFMLSFNLHDEDCCRKIGFLFKFIHTKLRFKLKLNNKCQMTSGRACLTKFNCLVLIH